MNIKLVLISTISLLCFSLTTSAQDWPYGVEPCGTDHAVEDYYQAHPEHIRDHAAEEELEEWTKEFINDPSLRSGGGYVVPVVFHIIHVNGPENISKAQIDDAMRILNEDFSMTNADISGVVSPFDMITGNAGIEFRLAQKDPNGNCHSGINRIYSTRTYDGDENMKGLINWPRDMYLNVWVCINSAGAAGYTFKPGAVNSWWMEDQDGIVINHDYVGSIGTGNYTKSRALTHEVGHWINLDHPWGGSNDPGLASNCSIDDAVGDTPNTIGWTSCLLSGTSCSSLDNVQNFMEYSYCSRMFTVGQANRMVAAIESNTADRRDLWQPSNLSATGTDGPDILCDADFYADVTVICAGDSIQFTDESFHGVTQWNWSHSGGSPSNSTDQHPWVTYDTPGTYDVTLEAGNGSSTVNETKTAYILVLPAVGAAPPYAEGFESGAAWPMAGWYNVNPGGQTWQTTNSAAYSGTYSLRINNRLSADGDIDEFISQTFDMTSATTAKITFRYAFKETNSANTDKLQVLVSGDCGKTWSIRKTLTSTNLVTSSGFTSTNWYPSSSEWGYSEVTSIPSMFWSPDFRFAFRMTCGGGNNVFVDDINLEVGVGIDEHETSYGLNIYPNPMDDASTIEFNLPNSDQVDLAVIDLVGKQVLDLGTGSMGSGRHLVDLPAGELAPGVYFVRLQVADQAVTSKIIVN